MRGIRAPKRSLQAPEIKCVVVSAVARAIDQECSNQPHIVFQPCECIVFPLVRGTGCESNYYMQKLVGDADVQSDGVVELKGGWVDMWLGK